MSKPSEYEPKYCQIVIDEMSKGLSEYACAGFIGINRSTLYRWKESFPEFKEACEMGNLKGRYIWEKMGIGGVTGKIKGFNAAAWIFNMKNRYNWRDLQEINSANLAPIVLKYSLGEDGKDE